jgi:hypothetical protein
MMKTATVQLSDLLAHFTACQTDYIRMIDDLDEREDAVDIFLRDLRNLMTGRRGAPVPTLRRLFSEGFTMMLLPVDQFDILDAANMADEDFCLVVKDGLETLCILAKNELSW